MLNFLRAAPTTYDNDPVCQLLRVLHFSAPRPWQSTSSQLHLIPSPLVWALWKCDASKAESNRKDILHTCVFEATLTWRRWNLQRKSPAPWALPLSHPLSRPLLMNYLSPQSIDAFSCILHPSWDRWFSFICAVIIVGGRGRADTTWKPKFNCCHRRAHLRERRVAVLAAGHAASKKFPPRTLMLGLAADKPQSLRGTEIERSTRGGLALFVRTCVCALLKSIRAAHNKHPWNRDGGVRRVISEVIEGR